MPSARSFWQMTTVICLFCVFAAHSPAQGPSRRFSSPGYLQIGKADQAEGKKIMEEFRKAGLYAGENYFEFELRVMPRRGEERLVPGRIWVGRNAQGPISRIVVHPGVVASEQRLLVQNGPESKVWGWTGKTGVTPLGVAALFDRLADTDVTPFDLEMPFLYWAEYKFEGVFKVRGRPAHGFLMYPPEVVSGQKNDLSGIRLYLDTQYHQPVQVEYISSESKTVKTVTVVDLKKIGDQWVVKSIDFRDENTRNKSRFSVVGAAVGEDFPEATFEPAVLAELIQPPRSDRIQKIDP